VSYRIQDRWQCAVLCLTSAVLFCVLYFVNDWLLNTFEYSSHISWIFLPAGVRVIIVMVMGIPGALGIILGSWAVSWFGSDPVTLLEIGNGIISGVAPWLIVRIVLRGDAWSDSLAHLTPGRLLGLVLAYALGNALLHHGFWWWLNAPELSSWQGFVPMVVGDLLGALVLLYLLKWLLDRWPLPTSVDR